MHEFPSFVYLDMEKTGSKFIRHVLTKFSSEGEVQRDHHQAMPVDCDRSKFYFMSVRDPLDAYISLYSFGCQAKGKLYSRLASRDLDHHYDGTTEGFNEWLRFTLKKKNGGLVSHRSGKASRILEIIGPQSYRYIRLALPAIGERLKTCATREEIRALYEAEKLPAAFIRYENFVSQLCELLRGPLRHWIVDVDAAVNFVETAKPMNASERVDRKADFEVPQRMRNRVREREWFLSELFGY